MLRELASIVAISLFISVLLMWAEILSTHLLSVARVAPQLGATSGYTLYQTNGEGIMWKHIFEIVLIYCEVSILFGLWLAPMGDKNNG